MRQIVAYICFAIAEIVSGIRYTNNTLDAVQRQLLDFKSAHPQPIGVITTSSGKPVEIRQTVTLNTDSFNNPFFWDSQSAIDHERIPERVAHARGAGAYGYFEVTNDVSKYTKADVFNGIGKKTRVVGRFSYANEGLGGSDLNRQLGALAVKFYTKEGNLDLLGVSQPIFFFNTPALFPLLLHSNKRNPKTNIYDSTARFDMLAHAPEIMHVILWQFSDFGLVNGYRRMNIYPVHTFELVNQHGESYFARFNFKTEQGLELLTNRAAGVLRGNDPDYSTRDLYNAIEAGNFPSWRLDIDVIPKHDIPKLNYNPFDMTILWRNGTYRTVTIGRLVFNKNPDNVFKDLEQAAFYPGNLVPGIPGPSDQVFQVRRFAYRDAAVYRLGINYNNIQVNCPRYSKVYNRDGKPPVLNNMKDAPNYYQNSFHGPVPYVDEARPKEALSIKYRSAVDIEEDSYFYNTYVNTEGKRNRLAANMAGVLVNVADFVAKEWLRIVYLISPDLGKRTEAALPVAQAKKRLRRPKLQLIEQDPRTLDLSPNHVCRCD